MNLARVLSESASRHPDNPAVVFEGTSHSYRAFDREVEPCAAMLQAEGVGKGERVAVQLTKRMEFLYLHFAVLSVGAIPLPLNPEYREGEVGYFLSDSGSSLYVADAERFRRVAGAIRGLKRVRTLLVGDAVVEGGGGTTGRSKGAMITHRNLVSNMRALSEAWEWTKEDVLLHVLPLFHVHGLNVATHGSLCAGSTIVMHEKFEPRRVWEALEKERCTLLMAVPTIYQRLMGEWEKRERKPDLHGMRVFISGSAPLSHNLFHRFERATGFRILERYGMTG